MALPTTGIDKFDEYTSQVMHGRIEVCKWVRLAVERHYRDLDMQRTEEFPYYFEPKACMHYVNFYEENLQHFDGFFKGQPIVFEPWQYLTFASPYSWLQTERIMNKPVRRFNESIVIIPKKQGKSIIKAGEMLYMLLMDDYPAAQIYILAVNATHADLLAYRDATLLVKNSPALSEMFENKEIQIKEGAQFKGIYYKDRFIKPITSDAKKTDGPKIHMALLEEIKDWDDFDVYNTIKNGGAADPNPMVSNITTAGNSFSSLGYEREEYARQVLTGEIKNDRTFAIVFKIEEAHLPDWDKLETAKLVNPNYGVSVNDNYYLQKIEDAKHSERKKNDYLTKHLGWWVNSYDAYFTMDKWVNIPDMYNDSIGKTYGELSLEDFAGKPCYMFIDLASKKDIVPVQFMFRLGKTKAFTDKDGKRKNAKDRYATFGHYFLPANVVSEDLIGHRADYNAWAEQGLFDLTPGNVVDYDAIFEYVLWAVSTFKVMMVGMDDWGIEQFAQRLKKKRIKTVHVPLRVKYISDPMKDLESYIINEGKGEKHDPRMIHNGDEVLRWTMGNVVAKEDKNENVFPNKEHKNKKIDPAVSLICLMYMNTIKPLPRELNRRKPIIMKV